MGRPVRARVWFAASRRADPLRTVLRGAVRGPRGVDIERAPGIQAIGFILRPDSEGTLAITTADPRGPLDIDPDFFATEHDQRIAAATFRGPSPDDVVDSRLRVRGVSGLRVVDCSVMPVMVSGNLNGPTMAMAWRAADLIRSGCRGGGILSASGLSAWPRRCRST